MAVRTDETKIQPLYEGPRLEQILAREEALVQRLEVVRAEARKPRPDPLDAWVTELTGDPTAVLSAPSPTLDQSREIQALERARAKVQEEAARLRSDLSRELAARLRPARAARARALAAALEQAIGVIVEDVASYRQTCDAGYDAPPLLLSAADRDVLVRMLDRVRARQGG